jgi:long-chain acyl-CoA synthetase
MAARLLLVAPLLVALLLAAPRPAAGASLLLLALPVALRDFFPALAALFLAALFLAPLFLAALFLAVAIAVSSCEYLARLNSLLAHSEGSAGRRIYERRFKRNGYIDYIFAPAGQIMRRAEPAQFGFTYSCGRITIAALFRSSHSGSKRNRMENSSPQTLVELLKMAAAARPDDQVLKFKQGKQWTGLSGDGLLGRVRSVTLGLYRMGVGRGDRVAMLAESGPLWTISDFAILSSGAVNVPIYPTQPVHQVEYIMREAEPKLLFISTARQMRRVNEALKKFPSLPIVSFQPGVEGENVTSFESLEASGAELARERPELYDLISSDVSAGDLASVIYTSGTTGEPKGVMLTHRNITFNALSSGRFLGIEPDNLMLSFLPLSHVFERMVLYLCMHYGVQINYAGGIETVASDMREVSPTLMSTVPRLIEKIYARVQKNASDAGGVRKRIFEWASRVARRSAELSTASEPLPPLLEFQRDIADQLVFSKLREAVGGRMRRMVSGGAALPSDLALFFIGAGIPLLQGYGLTETSPVIAVNTLEHNRIGSVGRPLPGVEVKIAEDGEILTRGPHVFQGYFNKPDETAEVFTEVAEGNGDRGAWFRTGDIGHFDEDGFLFITDRKKDLIKTSAGKYVAPQMIEGLIAQSEFIEQAVVIGDKRKYVIALIVPDFERLRAWAKQQGIETSDRRELIADKRTLNMVRAEVSKLTGELADYEKVKRVSLLADEFSIDGGELTPTLKVRRRVVEQKYEKVIESLYSGSD